MAERGAVGMMGSWERLSRRGAWLGTVLLLAGVLAGQSQSRAQTPVQTPVQTTGNVSVRLVDLAGLEAEIARHAGKVVVVDFWSTSCPPCVKEFPRLVALKKSSGERIACISFSLDYEGIDAPEELLPTIEKFLDKVGAAEIVNLLSTEEADAVYRKLDLVSVPAVYVYGPDGKLAQRFDEDDATKRLKRPFTYDDVEGVVGRLLGK